MTPEEQMDDINSFNPRHLDMTNMSKDEIADTTLHGSLDEPPLGERAEANGSIAWKVRHEKSPSGFLLCVRDAKGIITRYQIVRVAQSLIDKMREKAADAPPSPSTDAGSDDQTTEGDSPNG